VVVVASAIAGYSLLPKRYMVSEHLSQTVVFWNQDEAFLFLTVNTTGRATNIVQERLARTKYGYLALLLGGYANLYDQQVTAYHLRQSGDLDRFSLPAHTASYGSWTLIDGKLQLTPPETSYNERYGFRWDGKEFVPVLPQPKSQSQVVTNSKLQADDLAGNEDEDDGFLSASARKIFKDAGWHYKVLAAYQKKEEATLPIELGRETFNLTVRTFPAPTQETARFDFLSIGTKRIELSGMNLSSHTTQVLWDQRGWREISKDEYQSRTRQSGIMPHQPVAGWSWMVLLLALVFWRFAGWGHLLFSLVTSKSRILKNMATSYSFPPATPAQFPMLDIAALDRYTREFESMGFTRLLDFSLVADTASHPPSFCRLLAHTRHHCFAEISQIFPRGKNRPLKCSIQSCLQNGWTLSFSDRKPAAASSLLRRGKALVVSMPEATTSELLQSFLKMREQVCVDLGISPVNDDTLEAYIAKVQRSAGQVRDAVKQKNFVAGIPQIYYRKFGLLKVRPEYAWLGDYPSEAEKRKQGFTFAAGAH
jgi:hypothetical protein